MSKKAVPFLLAIPSMLLLVVLKIIPAINTLILSTKNYNIAKGMMNSPTVGLANYDRLMQNAVFPRAVLNTTTLSMLAIFTTCVLAVLLILLISSMPNRMVKTLAFLIIAIPAFIPPASFAGVVLRVLSPATGVIGSAGAQSVPILANSFLFGFVFAMMDALRSVFVPAIIGVLACEKEGIRFGRIMLVIAVYALIRITWFLSPDVELLMMVSNPLIMEKAEVFDTAIYRFGLVQMQISQAGALWVIKTIAQLVLNLFAFFGADLLLPKLKGIANTLSDKVNKGPASILSIFGYVLLALGSIGVIFAVFFPQTRRFSGGAGTLEGIQMLLSNNIFIQPFFTSLVCCIIGSILYAFMTLTLAMPMIVKTKIYPLLLIIIMSISNNTIGEFVFYRSLGMANTIFPVILASVSVAGAFALHFVVSNRLEDQTCDLKAYLKAAVLPLLALTVLYFIGNWGGFFYQSILIADRRMFSIGMAARELISQAAVMQQMAGNNIEAMKAAFILLSSIVPVALGTILICLNRVIPLTIFGAHSRKS